MNGRGNFFSISSLKVCTNPTATRLGVGLPTCTTFISSTRLIPALILVLTLRLYAGSQFELLV